MSIVSFADSSQTCVITTEHTLAQSNAAGTYILTLDLVNLADGDVLEVRAKVMARASGTLRGCYLATYYGAQPTDDLIKTSIPITTPLSDTGAVTFTIKQVAGTGRAVPFGVTRLS